LAVDVEFDHKQVIIGENNVGKTNFLRAIQLILDRDFSDNDRQLTESDFHESLSDPMLNSETIEIILQVKGFEHNSKLVAQFVDAVIDDTPPTLQFVYKFFPNFGPIGNILNYKYEIYKGDTEQARFTSEDRSFINIYVIKALRDVERELKANKNSPLYKLVKKYDISKEDLEKISESMKDAADDLLGLDEIIHIKKVIQDRFSTLSGLQSNNDINLSAFDIDIERLLYTLQVYFGINERPVGELSLGLGNILYITLMLILLKDRTIPPIIKEERFNELLRLDNTKSSVTFMI
jgi:putative ATP-dependent endonuclease of OLD family